MNVLRQLMGVGRTVVGLGAYVTFPIKDNFCIAVSISDSVCTTRYQETEAFGAKARKGTAADTVKTGRAARQVIGSKRMG